jgi:2-iminobutanoate/2-iminopropanoate deaminase
MARRPSIHELVNSRKVPKSAGAFSQGIKVVAPGETLFVSAMLPQEQNGRTSTGDAKKQAELVFAHFRNVVMDAKFTMDDVVQCRLYLTNINDSEAIEPSYQKMFVGQILPARTILQVAALPGGAVVALDAIVMKRGKTVDEALAEDE